MKRNRFLALALCMVLLTALLAGCSSASHAAGSAYKVEGAYETSAAYSAEAPYEAAMDAMAANGAVTEELPQNRKWIITGNMTVETEELDVLLSGMRQSIAQLGGYVESQDVSNGGGYSGRRTRYASLTARIPSDKVDDFTQFVEYSGNVTYNSRSVQDVTLSYVDTESRVLALQTEQTRLLELLAKAENMSDLLEIEARLSDVRYELERYTSQLKGLDNQIDYATIYISVNEVKEYTPVAEPTFGERISKGLSDNIKGLVDALEDFTVWFITSLPSLLFAAVIITLIVVVCIRISRRRKAKRIAKAMQQNQAQK